MGVSAQITAIIWKDVFVQLIKRHYFLALAEIFLVVLSFAGIENDRPYLKPEPGKSPLRFTAATVYEERNVSVFRAPQLILYTPNSTHTQALMAAAFPSEPPIKKGYSDMLAMAQVFKRVVPAPKRGPEQRIVGVELLSFEPSNRRLLTSGYPRDLQFRVDLYDDFRYLSQRAKSLRLLEPLPSTLTQRESLAFVQMALAHGHMTMVRNELKSQERRYTIVTNRIPEGPYPKDVRSRYGFTALRVGVGYMVPFCTLVGRLVEEHHSGMREKLRFVGLNSAIYFLGHFIASMMVGLVAVLCNMTHMLVAPNWESGAQGQTYLSGIDKFVVFIIFLIFSVMYIVKAMLVSLFFRNATAAVVFALCYWLTAYLVPWFAFEDFYGYAADYITLGRTTKLLTAFSPCMGLHWCFRILGCAAITGEEYTFGSVNEEVLGLDNVKMVEIWIMMLAYTVMIAIMIWYFGNVVSYAIGVPLEPWFPFTVSYWIPGTKGSVQIIEPKAPDGYHFQKYPPGEAVVTVSQLEYEGKQRHVLRDTNFKAYSGEILGIVAPSGAGKTSLCNILTGFLPPSAGQVSVFGYDMALQTALARQHVAYVQQRSVLFLELTVYEHLVFFGSMRHEAYLVLGTQLAQVRDMLQLGPIMHIVCNKLDVSQKKMLGLAVALMTCPKVLVMDEVMVRMVPSARKVAWNALISLKGTMCIIAATQNVYEVDTRADRLAVLGYAAHKCYGTTSFIQKRYGWGYTVRVMKGLHFNGRAVLANIRQTIPGARVLQDQRGFAAICIGYPENYTLVATMLQRLEANQSAFSITSLTVSFVTMEDIFFRIVLEMDSGDYQYKQRIAGGAGGPDKRHGVTEDVAYTAANMTVLTEDQGGIIAGGEKYESSIEIQEHVKAVYDLKPETPGPGQLFVAMIYKRRHYTWQTLALPMFCFIVPTVILVLRGEFETTSASQVSVPFTADNIAYDLSSFQTTEKAFVAFDDGSRDIEAGYQKYIESKNFPVDEVPNFQQFLDRAKETRGGYTDYLFGAQFVVDKNDANMGKAVAWFSGDAFHTQSLSINVISTALLNKITNDPDDNVLAVLRPLKHGKQLISSRHLENAKYAEDLGNMVSLRLTTFILLPAAISVATASFIFFPVDDRVSNSKRMQFVSGVSPAMYWLANYVWDMFIALVGLMCMLFPTFIFYKYFRSYAIMSIAIHVMHMHSMLPFVYFFSFLTDSMVSGFLVVNALTFFTGVVSTLGYQLYMVETERGMDLISTEHPRDPLLWFLYLLPPFSASWAHVKVIQLATENAYCSYTADSSLIYDVCAFVRNSAEEAAIMMTGLRYCCATYYKSNRTSVQPLSTTSFHRDGAMMELTVMFIEGIVCLVVLILVEHAVMRHWFASVEKIEEPAATGWCPDVLAERIYVNKVLERHDLTKPSLLALDLKKSYGQVVALRGVSFHVDPGETLAVLGTLGSGKSTLLDVLSGIQSPSGGVAYIGNVSHQDVARWEKSIGLCPEYDTFLGRLTVRQTLTMFAFVRGVQHQSRVTLVEHLFALLNLTDVAEETIDSVSASSRRKLAVAVAIVGLPPVLLLDDPATGLDPFAKRTIYKSVHVLRQLSKSAVLLVTTSLCDAVIMSDRMAIMVDGVFRSIGTLHELQSRLCKGFVLKLKLKPEAYYNPVARKAIDSTVTAALPKAVFCGQVAAFVEYEIERLPHQRELARILTDMKHHLGEYVFDALMSEVTLEHVILKTAKYQVASARGPAVSS